MKRYLIIITCVVYIISPLDLLPEAFLGPLGLPDDIAAIILALRTAFWR